MAGLTFTHILCYNTKWRQHEHTAHLHRGLRTGPMGSLGYRTERTPAILQRVAKQYVPYSARAWAPRKPAGGVSHHYLERRHGAFFATASFFSFYAIIWT